MNKIIVATLLFLSMMCFAGYEKPPYVILKGGTGNTSGTATVNANLTGPITSVGNATSLNLSDGSIGVTKIGGTSTYIPYFDATGFMGTDSAFFFNDTTKVVTAGTFSGPLLGHASSDLALTGGTLTGPLTAGTFNITAATFIGNVSGSIASASNIAGGSAGSLPYQSAVATTSMLGIGTIGQILNISSGTLPAWTSTIPTTSVAGTNTQVMYMDSINLMGGDSRFTYNDSTNILSAGTISGLHLGNITGGTAANSSLILQSTTTTGTSDFIAFHTAAQSEKMRITNAGNVGLGTTTPQSSIHITTSTFISPGGSGILIEESATTNNNTRILLRGVTPVYQSTALGTGGTISSPVTAIADTGLLSIQGGGYDSSVLSANKVRLAGAAESTWTTISNPTYMTISTTGTGSINATERVRINSAGNVGIGTTSPSSLLYVNGTQGAPSLSSNTNTIVTIASSSTVKTMFGAYTGSPYSGWMQVSDLTGSFYPLSINPLGGNVGIGTTTPQQTLDVNGNIAINGTMLISKTAVTMGTGGCTSVGPAIANSNGPSAFTFTVGTTCSGSQPIQLNLPTASNGWSCFFSHRIGSVSVIIPTSVSASSVVISNYSIPSVAFGQWASSETIQGSCNAY